MITNQWQHQQQKQQQQQQDQIIGTLAEVTPNTVGVAIAANGNGGTAVRMLVTTVIEFKQQ